MKRTRTCVRYSVLDLEGGNRVNQPASEFPPDDVVDTKYYLHGLRRTLSADPPSQEVAVAYDAESNPGLVSFIVRFTEETVLVGYPKARLRVGSAVQGFRRPPARVRPASG